jgi:predicted HAD superfamily Cof-like phosphohydrolase
MEKLDSLNQVAQFHQTFGAPIVDNPAIPSADRCQLRVSLLAEELDELKEAIAANDLVEIADALCDLQYVLSGAVLEFGMGEKFVELFNEVQRSNMSKACQSLAEAEATVKFYADKDGTEAEIVAEHGLWKVYRKSDNKVLKSINYSPADLVSILR